ncbi:hypothetical protein SAFG77S_08537 [Streptomyces afghaniensis]
MSESTAVLLIGITGSGKTHLAQALSARGVVRLSVDEEVHRLHGRYGVDYPEHEYFEREAPAVENRTSAAYGAAARRPVHRPRPRPLASFRSR